MKNLSKLFVLLATAVGVINCSNSTEPEPAATTTTAEIPAVFKNFTSNVKVSVSGDYVVLQTDDLPNHPSPYFGAGNSKYEAYNGSNPNFMLNPNRITTQSITFRIPMNPKAASTHQSTSLGPIGISVNGVVFFNQYAAGFQPLTNEINTLDQYNGHPQQQGQYHYHIEPLYLTAKNGKAALLGFLLDGFPVYGPQENGKMLANADLDQYHGHAHATAEYPNGIYHYHITEEVPYLNGGQYYGTPGAVTQ